MKSKIVALSKNEEFKSLLKKKKISNKFVTIFFGHLIKKDNKKLNISFVTKKKIGNAVKRNKIKRRIKEIIRKNGYSDFLSTGFVFSVFRPFAELSYASASKEIQEAIEEIKKIS